eukprot:gene1348-biopygen2642
MGRPNVLFGGKVVVLGGDFRQILPVVPPGNRGEIVAATLKRSNIIWPHVQMFRLHENMRVSTLRHQGDEQLAQQLEEFICCRFLKRVGEGSEQEYPDVGESVIRIPPDMCCGDADATVNDFIQQVFGGLQHLQPEHRAQHIIERAILTSLNQHVDALNQQMMEWMSTFDGGAEQREYLSADGIVGDASDLHACLGQVPGGCALLLRNDLPDQEARIYVDPHGRGHRQVHALQELGQAAPLEGEDLPALKDRLAAGAAEALEQQLIDCERLVRTKLLARKLGYGPNRNSSSSGDSRGSGSNSSRSTEAGSQQQQQQHVSADISALLSAAVLSSPGGLSSHQHRAAVEGLIDQHLDQLVRGPTADSTASSVTCYDSSVLQQVPHSSNIQPAQSAQWQ